MCKSKVFFFLLFFFNAFVLSAQVEKGDTIPSRPVDKYTAIIEKAELAVSNQQFEEARMLYKQAIEIRPGDEFSFRMLRNVENSIKTLAKASEVDQDLRRKAAIQTLFNEAQNAVVARNYELARDNYIKILALKPVKSQEDFAKQKIQVINSVLGTSPKSNAQGTVATVTSSKDPSAKSPANATVSAPPIVANNSPAKVDNTTNSAGIKNGAVKIPTSVPTLSTKEMASKQPIVTANEIKRDSVANNHNTLNALPPKVESPKNLAVTSPEKTRDTSTKTVSTSGSGSSKEDAARKQVSQVPTPQIKELAIKEPIATKPELKKDPAAKNDKFPVAVTTKNEPPKTIIATSSSIKKDTIIKGETPTASNAGKFEGPNSQTTREPALKEGLAKNSATTSANRPVATVEKPIAQPAAKEALKQPIVSATTQKGLQKDTLSTKKIAGNEIPTLAVNKQTNTSSPAVVEVAKPTSVLLEKAKEDEKLKRRIDINRFLDSAITATKYRDWAAAVNFYKQVLSLNPTPDQKSYATNEIRTINKYKGKAGWELPVSREIELAAKKPDVQTNLKDSALNSKKLGQNQSREADLKRQFQIDQLLNAALTAVKNENWVVALENYNKMLALNPTPGEELAAKKQLETIYKNIAKTTKSSSIERAVMSNIPAKPEEIKLEKPVSNTPSSSASNGFGGKASQSATAFRSNLLPEQSYDPTDLENLQENVDFSKRILNTNGRLNIIDSVNDVKLICQSIAHNGRNTFVKFLVQNKNPTSDFNIGTLQMTYIKNYGIVKKVNPRYITDTVIVPASKELPLVYVTETPAQIQPDEVFIFELEDRLKKTKLSVNISGETFISSKLN